MDELEMAMDERKIKGRSGVDYSSKDRICQSGGI
jgi:hypothetical protein